MVYLVKMLERSNVELLILATTFLKKLSIYKVRCKRAVCVPPLLTSGRMNPIRPVSSAPLLNHAVCTHEKQETMAQCRIHSQKLAMPAHVPDPPSHLTRPGHPEPPGAFQYRFTLVTFLPSLTPSQENKETMAQCRIVEKLMKFVPVLNDVLLMSVLRLLHNLSFDHTLRDDMVKHGLIPKVRANTVDWQVAAWPRGYESALCRGGSESAGETDDVRLQSC